MINKTIQIFSFVLIAFSASYAQAQVKYYPVNYKNIAKTYWFLSIWDVNNDKAVDEFVRLNDCSVYETYYSNDFQWQNIRKAVREEIMREKTSYPFRYEVVAPVQLDRYDFDSKMFMFTEKSALTNVTALELLGRSSYKPYCGLKNPAYHYPGYVFITFKEPLNINGVPLPQNQANALLKRLQTSGNRSRTVFVKTKFRMSGLEDFKERAISNVITLKAVVEGIDIYEDPDATKLIYSMDK